MATQKFSLEKSENPLHKKIFSVVFFTGISDYGFLSFLRLMTLSKLSNKTKLAIGFGLILGLRLLRGLAKNTLAFNNLNDILSPIFYSIGGFCLFFIWFWKPQQIQNDRFTRYVLHVFCVFTLFSLTYNIAFMPKESVRDWTNCIFLLIWGILLSIKYKTLFWPKKRKAAVDKANF